jgi:hypothetical protein
MHRLGLVNSAEARQRTFAYLDSVARHERGEYDPFE